jgi:hypothetical protein
MEQIIELSNYQKQKEAIYRWRNKNLIKYHQAQQEHNRKNYEKNRLDIIIKVKNYQLKKQAESGNIKKRVGRPCKIYDIIDNKNI